METLYKDQQHGHLTHNEQHHGSIIQGAESFKPSIRSRIIGNLYNEQHHGNHIQGATS